jgi:hypothetical protein
MTSFSFFVFGAEFQIDQIQRFDMQRRQRSPPRRHESLEDMKLPPAGFFSIVQIPREPDGHNGAEKDRDKRQNVIQVHGFGSPQGHAAPGCGAQGRPSAGTDTLTSMC